MTWYRAKHVINKNGYLVKVKGEPWESYDPFDYYAFPARTEGKDRLHFKLLNLDIKDEQAILNFVESFGLLGANYFRDIGDSLEPYPGTIADEPKVSGPKEDRRGLWWERLRAFKEEALILKLTVHLKSLREDYPASRLIDYIDRNAELIARLSSWLGPPLDMVKPETRRLKKASVEQRLVKPLAYLFTAGYLIEEWFNRGLETVRLQMTWKQGELVESWKYPSLLSAIYLMFYLDSKGEFTRQCHNKTCGQLFPTTNASKKFCDNYCAQAEMSRRYRNRKGTVKDNGNG